MERKPKPKKCTECKTEFTPWVSTQLVCSPKCGIEYARKKDAKKQAKKLKERKQRLQPITFWLDKCQVYFNKFIRLRDKGKPCVSCGKPDDGTHQRHASHYRSRGGCSSLRFDEFNVHASCAQCNNWKSGNIAGYTPELIDRIGESEFQRIKNAPKSYKWDKEEVLELISIYKGKVKDLS